MGLDKDTYSVTIPLGATINMDGAAITITVMTLAAAHTLGIAVDIPSAVILSILATLSACGAIIATGGKQYKVAEGDVIKVERLGAGAGETVTFDQVLAVNNGELQIGCPTVAGATVTATVEKEGKGKKVIVYKYKRKTGYHKKNGHRQLFTQVKIEKINA